MDKLTASLLDLSKGRTGLEEDELARLIGKAPPARSVASAWPGRGGVPPPGNDD